MDSASAAGGSNTNTTTVSSRLHTGSDSRSQPNSTSASVYAADYSPSSIRSHLARDVTNSAAYLLPHLENLHAGDITAPVRILDVGCGPGTLTVSLAREMTRIFKADNASSRANASIDTAAEADTSINSSNNSSSSSSVGTIPDNKDTTDATVENKAKTKVKVIGIDFSADVISQARELLSQEEANGSVEPGTVEFEVCDVHDLSRWTDGEFDVVHAHQVLQHVKDPVGVLREMRRVARQGSVPATPSSFSFFSSHTRTAAGSTGATTDRKEGREDEGTKDEETTSTSPPGIVAIRESAANTFFPDTSGLRSWESAFFELGRRLGGDPYPGRKLHVWAREAGFDRDAIRCSTSSWLFRTRDEREFWGGMFAHRVTETEWARNAVREGVVQTEKGLRDMATAWRKWVDDDDGWFNVLHGEIVCLKYENA